MLLIWDIHITSRYADKILSEVKTWVESNPSEKNIIFLWDYVYHFSYDRNALLALYSFFIKLFEEGKNVYILAWNHDWLGNNFVFEEAKKAFDIIWWLNKDGVWKVNFINQPIVENIDWEDILFLPYMISEQWEIKYTEWLMKELSESNNKNEKISAMVNTILSEYVDKYDKLTVIHHYYINKTKFPWQKSIFRYKDVSLSEDWLDNPKIRLISWHLHQWFIYKNYLCTWSIWSTSSLESNQNKYLWRYEWNWKVSASGIDINPYILIESETPLNQEWLQDAYNKIWEENKKNLSGNDIWEINFEKENNLNAKDVSVFLKVKDINYENIDSYIEPELRMKIKDVKLKKDFKDSAEILKNFELSSKNLETTFADWKEILKLYLQSKYWDSSSKYEEILHEMKLL